MKPRLLIVTSHPIQYQAPWFRVLHTDPRIDLEVLFLALPDAQDQGGGFGTAFEWDVPLLNGYSWRKAASASGRISRGYFDLKLANARADILALQPDVILVTGWQHYGMLQCLRAAVRSGKPVLVRAESNGLKPVGLLPKLKARIGLSGVKQILPIGVANEQFYRQVGMQSSIGPKVPYFVDNAFFAGAAEAARQHRRELRAKFGISADAVCFLFAGKLVKKKRPLDAVHALQKVVESNSVPHVHLLVVGSGELEPAMRQFVAAHRLPVSFAGFLNQTRMPEAYAVADCLLLPSDYGETWGLVVNEAMACGLPAIVSDRAGCGPDLIHPGRTGFLHKFGAVPKLAEAMRQFLSMDDEKRQCLGFNARNLVESGYSVALAADRTAKAVLQVCAT